MTKITISLYALTVEVECDANHPDALTDAANRASVVFIGALLAAKENQIDPMRILEQDFDEED
jgi:hypothetical protein